MSHTTRSKAGSQDTPGPPPPCKRRLQSAQDVRVFLADVANRLNRDELDTAKAKGLAYIISILNNVISTSDLEARLIALEDAKEQRR